MYPRPGEGLIQLHPVLSIRGCCEPSRVHNGANVVDPSFERPPHVTFAMGRSAPFRHQFSPSIVCLTHDISCPILLEFPYVFDRILKFCTISYVRIS